MPDEDTVVTTSESQQVAIQLQQLIGHHAVFRTTLTRRLKNAAADTERAEIERVIDLVDKDVAELQLRLAMLQTGTGGTA